MPYTVNIFNSYKNKHQNPRYDSKKLLENNKLNTNRQSNKPFRMPLLGSRKTIVCGPCTTNTKVIKSMDLEESCIKLCYRGNSVIKRSKDGIITNSNFRFTSMGVLERNNKSFNQNEFNFTKPIKKNTFYPEDYKNPELAQLKSGEVYTNDYLINNSNKTNLESVPGSDNNRVETEVGIGEFNDPGNNGGVKCGLATYKFSNSKFLQNGGVSSKNVINYLKYNNNFISQINNCNNGDDCNIYQNMNYKDIDNETFCFPNRLNGKKQTCFVPENYQIIETITIEGVDMDELKEQKGNLINIFLQKFNVEEKDLFIYIQNNKFRIRALKKTILKVKMKTSNIFETKNLIYKFNVEEIKQSLNKLPGIIIQNVKIENINEKLLNDFQVKKYVKTSTPILFNNNITKFNTLKFSINARTLPNANVYVYVNNIPYGNILNGSEFLTIKFKMNPNMMNTQLRIYIQQKEDELLMSNYSNILTINLDSKVSKPSNFIVNNSNPIIKVYGDDGTGEQEIRDTTKPLVHNTLYLNWDKNLDRDISG